jgi:class 3 adenylate cyclase
VRAAGRADRVRTENPRWDTWVVKPEPVRYAWNGDISLAYQVVGNGPLDLLICFGYMSNLDVQWESRYLSRFLQRLAEGARVIVTDRRGWGCSDRFSPTDVPALEALAADLPAVLDAAGSERAVVLATMESGMIAQLFAAAHPERVAGLILLDSLVSWSATPETPWMPNPPWWESNIFDDLRANWGVSWLHGTAPVADDRRELDWYLRYQRACEAPGAMVAEQRRFLESSTAGVLGTIQAPTLVLSVREKDTAMVFQRKTSRYLAEQIVGATLVELDYGDQLWWYEPADRIVDEAQRFLGGVSGERALFDRVLATVLFTDIVASTERVAELGDRGWKILVERHHALVRNLLARFRGTEVDTAGDGFFATFDGPARAVLCAQAITAAAASAGLPVRAGIHTGECELIDGKVAGISVVVGARVAGFAESGDVLVTRTVKDLVAGSGLTFEPRGEHSLKGIPDRWQLYAATAEEYASQLR